MPAAEPQWGDLFAGLNGRRFRKPVGVVRRRSVPQAWALRCRIVLARLLAARRPEPGRAGVDSSPRAARPRWYWLPATQSGPSGR
ncbi:hypothetical protein GCM10010266_58210 [Streptomyces griseomycini]|uniref:Uncharacterized protein n=1 Tax=Streptomyces griseomycini TaxID=66895 RepID=A0A7W7PWG4_9ACTN|nr:hypothetical protein [Streptomyces griseomycini]GGQ27296.1 hypothetical protein GCM10010266_58210 [Streptomyces griseomycini]